MKSCADKTCLLLWRIYYEAMKYVVSAALWQDWPTHNTCSTPFDLHSATQQKLAEISHQQSQGYVTSQSSCAWYLHDGSSLTMCHNITWQTIVPSSHCKWWKQGVWEAGSKGRHSVLQVTNRWGRGRVQEQHQVCLTFGQMNSTQALTMCIIHSCVYAVLLMLQLHTIQIHKKLPACFSSKWIGQLGKLSIAVSRRL